MVLVLLLRSEWMVESLRRLHHGRHDRQHCSHATIAVARRRITEEEERAEKCNLDVFLLRQIPCALQQLRDNLDLFIVSLFQHERDILGQLLDGVFKLENELHDVESLLNLVLSVLHVRLDRARSLRVALALHIGDLVLRD